MLTGYKSYLCGLGIIVVSALHASGVITEEFQTILMGILGGGSVMALRSALTTIVATILSQLVAQGKTEADKRIAALEAKK